MYRVHVETRVFLALCSIFSSCIKCPLLSSGGPAMGKDDRNDDVTRSNSSQFYLDNGQLHKIDKASFVIRNFVINISLLTLLFTIANLICLVFSLRTSQSLEVGKARKIIRILTLVIFIVICIAVILEHVTIFLDKLEIIKKKWELFVASIFLGFAIILTFVLAIAVLIYFLRKKLASKRGIKGVDCPDVRSGSETTPQAPPTTSSRGVPSLDARNCLETAPQVPARTSFQGLPGLPKARTVETGEGVCSLFQLYVDENAGNVNGAFVGTLTRSKQLPKCWYCSINRSPQNVKKHTKSQPGSAQFHVNGKAEKDCRGTL